MSWNGFSHQIHSPQCTAIYIFTRVYSHQRRPQYIFMLNIQTYLYFGRQMQKDTRLDPHAHMYATDIHTNTQRSKNIFGRIVYRPRTYRINDICHRFSLFFFVFASRCPSLAVFTCVCHRQCHCRSFVPQVYCVYCVISCTVYIFMLLEFLVWLLGQCLMVCDVVTNL